MLSRFGELGLLKSRGKARTDSTHILAAVKELTRLEHLEETEFMLGSKEFLLLKLAFLILKKWQINIWRSPESAVFEFANSIRCHEINPFALCIYVLLGKQDWDYSVAQEVRARTLNPQLSNIKYNNRTI